jgi:hypothetical protein
MICTYNEDIATFGSPVANLVCELPGLSDPVRLAGVRRMFTGGVHLSLQNFSGEH